MNTDSQFAALGLAQPLLRAIADAGYTTPTPIQIKAIPLVLAGGDLLAAAQTGTGKTAGFVLPILHRLYETAPEAAGGTKPGRPRCLILTPTRELAAQVEESVRIYGKHVALKSMMMFGGVGMQPQVTQLKKRVDILVATPGRLLDHCGQKTVDLSGIEILVLDEGDRMLDMGFIRDIKRVLAYMPKQRQSLLFSATFSDDVRALAGSLLNKPSSVEVAARNTASELVKQTVHLVNKDEKRDVLSHLIRSNSWTQVLVFTRTKHGANRLAEKLEKDGIKATAIHGNKSQAARTRALAQFKAGEVPVLVATDIAARGLDIEELPHVVNFELPNVAEDYVHRIGRTGRAGVEGAAVSLVDSEEIPFLRAIEKLLKRSIPRAAPLEGYVARPAAERAAEERARPPREPQRSRRDAPRGGQGRPGSQGRPGGQGRTQARDGQRTRTHAVGARPASEGNRAGADDDNRGNRIAPSRDDARGGRNREGGSRDGAPRARRDDPARSRSHHQAGNAPRMHPTERPEVDGNRAQPARAAEAPETMSEAARHQAKAQPALFSPKAQVRRWR
ncbi:MAG: box helicase domain protein [Betaproteobacteria bacterium]|nr:box helicase domain protein [Betaproteobacteria bacterium]